MTCTKTASVERSLPDGVELPYAALLVLCVAGAAYSLIFTIVAAVLAVSILMKANMQRLLEVQFLLLPMAGVLQIAGGFSILNIVFIVALVRAFQLNGCRIEKPVALLLSILLVVDAMSLLRSGGSGFFDLMAFNVQILTLGFVLSWRSEMDLRRIVRLYAASLVFSSLICVFSDYLPGIKSYIRDVSFRYSDSGESLSRYAGLMGNPNYYTLSLNVAIAVLVSRIVVAKGRFLDVVLIVLMVVFGLLSLSKSFVLALAFTMLVVVAYLVVSRPLRTGLFLIAIMAVAVIALLAIGPQYADVLLERLLPGFGVASVDINQYTTYRFDKFALYTDYLVSHVDVLLFGNGFGMLIDGHASHNIFLEGIYYFGCIGFILLCAIFVYAAAICATGKGFLRFLPLLVFLFRGLAINAWSSITLAFYLAIILLELREDLLPGGRLSQERDLKEGTIPHVR